MLFYLSENWDKGQNRRLHPQDGVIGEKYPQGFPLKFNGEFETEFKVN